MSDPQTIRIRLLPRDLIVAWSIWLLASWAVNLWLNGGSPLPTLRHTLLASVLGIALVWPCWRLTLACPPRSAIAAFMDWLCIITLFQVVIVRVAVEHSFIIAMYIDAAIAAHSLLIAVIIDLGRRDFASGGGGRIFAMLIAVILFLGSALLALALPHSLAWISIFRVIWLATDVTAFIQFQRDLPPFAILAAAAAGFWIIAALLVPRTATAGDSQLPNSP